MRARDARAVLPAPQCIRAPSFHDHFWELFTFANTHTHTQDWQKHAHGVGRTQCVWCCVVCQVREQSAGQGLSRDRKVLDFVCPQHACKIVAHDWKDVS
eukprot:3791825-Amphidinium_carterae.1